MLEIQCISTSDGQSVCPPVAPEPTCVVECEALLGSTEQSLLKVMLLGSGLPVWEGLGFPNLCCVCDC